MKSVLEIIKENPSYFIGSCLNRSRTTPSNTNRANHIALSDFIDTENWEEVKNLISSPEYNRPLEGVILVAESVGLPNKAWHEAYDAWEAGKII